MAWLPFAVNAGEALIVFGAAFLGAIPGIPAHDWMAALALALAKLIPAGVTLPAIKGVAAPDPEKHP